MNHKTKYKLIRSYSENLPLISKRRAYIARMAARIIYERGYNSVSMQEIAKVCNMSIGNLYRYIGSKDDVLFLVINEMNTSIQILRNKITEKINTIDSIELLEWAIREYYKIMNKHKYLIVLGWREIKNLSKVYSQYILRCEGEIISSFAEILEKGCDAGQFKIDNVPIIANNIVVLGEMWGFRSWFLRKKCSLNQFISQQIEFICHGTNMLFTE